MPTKRSGDGHNVRVMRSALPQRARSALVAALVATVTSGLVLSGCGADHANKATPKAAADLPTGNVDVPSGVTLTKAGAGLKFGETATVAYEPNTRRSSVVELTTLSVQTGKISDLAAYQLDAQTKKARPYYVRARVKNVGTGDLSGAAVPLYAVDSSNALVLPSTFNNTFTKCPSTPLPAGFTNGKTAGACLVYLVPPGKSLVEMSFRPLQTFEPITWKGTITPAVTKKPAKKKHKKGQS
jgi:hypothetical protein